MGLFCGNVVSLLTEPPKYHETTTVASMSNQTADRILTQALTLHHGHHSEDRRI